MRHSSRRAACFAGLLLLASCTDGGPVDPVPQARRNPGGLASVLPAVRISEFHYDNASTDSGEFIEVSGPAGTDLTGWSLVLYNGANGAVYNTTALPGTIPDLCSGRGVVFIDYPQDGIQNGSPDGIALVDASAAVIEFISYEGTLTAAGGPALGMLSTDVGVSETASTPIGQSLQRNGAGIWSAPSDNTRGGCNDNDGTPPPVVDHVAVSPSPATIVVGGTQQFTATAFDAASQPIPGVVFTWTTDAPGVATVSGTGLATGTGAGDAQITATAPNAAAGAASLHVNEAPPPTGLPDPRFSEIHYDNVGTDAGEAIEVEGPAGTDLTGWSIVLYNGNGGVTYNTAPLAGTIPDLCDGRGVVVVSYPQDGIQNGSPDGFALVNGGGQVVEFLSYEGTFTATNGPASGMLSVDIGVAESSAPVVQSIQRDATGAWAAAAASFGGCNGGPPPPPPGNTISFSGRTPGDPALPVGFQDQIFATVRDGNGAVIQTTVTWTTETPAVASIDQNGVMTALGAGSAIFRATAADGITTATYTLPTRVAVASATALYAGNTEFGDPSDPDPSDDFILRHDEYTTSFNRNRGTPNWVSYDLDPTHFGAEDRCDCFTFDPGLPGDFPRYTTADYTGAGAFHGYGIDRGHLARSFDRTSASLDNAFTFYFSNIVPQAADLNQGPWAVLESYLGDLVRFQNKEVYIIAGVAGSKGTIKNEGRITIPASTWKVAVVMQHDQGLADVHSLQDLEVIAVNMPNDPGVRNVPWETYQTTVDAVEQLSGYDLLALLPDQIEIAVESGTKPPVPATDGPYVSVEGGSVTMSAAGSSDPDGDALSFAWDFGDGSTGTGIGTTHTYSQDGAFTVQLLVTDAHGLTSAATTTATVTNVAPAIGALAGATLLPGESYAASGGFTDPGADVWSATVDYGDGSGVQPLALNGGSFALSHTYSSPGSYQVTVRVADDDTQSAGTATVVVETASQGVTDAVALVNSLLDGRKIGRPLAVVLKAELAVARGFLDRGRDGLAALELRAVLAELDGLVRAGRLSAADAAPLGSLIGRIIDSLSP